METGHQNSQQLTSMSHIDSNSLSAYGKILKNHILLLANADINVPLYQNKDTTNIEKTENVLSSPKLDDKEDIDDDLKDPYSNFFNCLVENDFFLSMNKINKIINNNEIKYICYGNRLNFLNLIKFFSFKIVRLLTILNTKTYSEIDEFTEHTETLLKSIRFLTKLIPIFFEICYEEGDDDVDQFFTEDEVFWNANTSETYQDLKNPTENATIRAPDSIFSFDKLNKSPVSLKEDGKKSISSLNVEINFRSKQNLDEFSTQPNWFLDGVAQKNNMPLGISLLSALLKCLFMEGFTLPLSSHSSMGNISFHLWNNDALDLHNKDGNYSKMLNPTLDSNRLEVMDLLQVLFSNTLYSSKKIDNKFLASWCCSMPEYLSVYLINSLLNNFTDENNILAKSNITTEKTAYNPNFVYPSEYNIIKFKGCNSNHTNNANRMSLLKHNFSINNDFENSFKTTELINTQSSNFLPNMNNYVEENLTIEESSKLRESYLKTSRNILLLYFTFDPNAINQNTKLQIANSTSDINDYSNVCLRTFSSVNTLSDFKKILVSIVKVLKLPIDMEVEDDNKIFNLNNKAGSSFLDIFTKSSLSSNSDNKSQSSLDKPKDDSKDTNGINEIPLISQNLTAVLMIFNKMLECNEFFETHVLEIYSNKIFFILLFYIKKYHQNLHANSTFMTTLESLLLKITSNPIFSLRSMKFINIEYYTEKVPKSLKLLDKDLRIETETHRDFFIKQMCNIILKNVEMNHAPKINHYHILNNLLLATPQHLSKEPRGNINQLLQMEQKNESNALGKFTTGIDFLTSKKIILVLFAFIKNKEYLHTGSVDRNKNYKTQLEKSSIDHLKSRDSFSMNKSSSSSSYSYSANVSSCCDSLFSDTRNSLMYEDVSGQIDINAVSSIPYIFTVACKWECVAVMLKTITNVISQYFNDFAYLIYLLGKYKNIFYEISRVISILDADIANELQPLMLKFLPPGVSKKSIYFSSTLNIPFDIALHSYPTVLDEVLSIDDDSMNDFDRMALSVIKDTSITSISSAPIEDMFYHSGNNNISFISSENSSILDVNTGQRIMLSSGSMLSQHTDDDTNLSLNTGTISNKQLSVKEAVNDLFLPLFYNNATYNAVNCPRTLGMSKKRIKKMIVKHSDNFRQALTIANQNNKGFWFLGIRYLIYMMTFASKVNDVIGTNNSEGLQTEAQIKLLVKKIIKERQTILNDKKIVSSLPLEVTYYKNDFYIYPKVEFSPFAYQFNQTLVWAEIFNNNSVYYKYFSDEITGNADLLYSLNTSHTSAPSVDEGNTTPSSPMLERWNSNNSLSKVESNASGSSTYPSLLNTNSQTNKEIHVKTLSGGSDSFNGSIMEHIKYSTFLIESVGIKSDDLKFVVSSGLSHSLKWYNTNVKMFPIKKIETNEFSLIDYTSNFLNKFKFRNSIAVKTPEEVAADEMKRVYTPRSSISSIPSRK